ncbi:uncharacterized protein LOC143914177 [Arctopsyche grandis]|uniref:uncharacterized protein LOC143914177 n=1 Tax=Arctopsyche grandis TaxID=121162 RepID=UPI00406D8632
MSNTYTESIFHDALQEAEGIKMGGETITNIRYADDTALVTENLADLQRSLDRVHQESNRRGLRINLKKTKFMIVDRMQTDTGNLTLDGEVIERVKRFKYLGTSLNEEMDPDEDLRIRIEITRTAFVKK